MIRTEGVVVEFQQRGKDGGTTQVADSKQQLKNIWQIVHRSILWRAGPKPKKKKGGIESEKYKTLLSPLSDKKSGKTTQFRCAIIGVPSTTYSSKSTNKVSSRSRY